MKENLEFVYKDNNQSLISQENCIIDMKNLLRLRFMYNFLSIIGDLYLSELCLYRIHVSLYILVTIVDTTIES